MTPAILFIIYIAIASKLFENLVDAAQISILETPADIRFDKSGEQLHEKQLIEIYSAALGLSVKKFAEWPGISVLNPFLTASAVIIFHLHDVAEFASRSRLSISHIYPLSSDEGPNQIPRPSASMSRTWLELADRARSFSSKRRDNVLVDVDAARAGDYFRSPFGRFRSGNKTGTSFGPCEGQPGQLTQPVTPYMLRNGSHAAEYFLKELSGLNIIADRIKKLKEYYAENEDERNRNNDAIKDIFIISIRSLRPLMEQYGSDRSPAVITSFALLATTLANLATACQDLYQGRALVTVLADDLARTYRKNYQQFLADSRQRRSGNKMQNDTDEFVWVNNGTNNGVEWYNIPYPGLVRLTSEERKVLNRAKMILPHTNALFAIAMYFSICLVIALAAIILAFLSMDVGETSSIYRLTLPRKKRN